MAIARPIPKSKSPRFPPKYQSHPKGWFFRSSKEKGGSEFGSALRFAPSYSCQGSGVRLICPVARMTSSRGSSPIGRSLPCPTGSEVRAGVTVTNTTSSPWASIRSLGQNRPLPEYGCNCSKQPLESLTQGMIDMRVSCLGYENYASSLRFVKAALRVSSSAYSMSPPVARPRPIRVILTPEASSFFLR